VQSQTAGPEITRAPLLRATVAFGMPLVVAMGLASLFNLVDLWIVARPQNVLQSPEVAVAAVTIPSLVNSIPMIIFNGIVNAMIALVARHHGLGSNRRASLAAGQGLLITLALGVVFGVPPWIYAEQICTSLGARGQVVAPATAYLAIMSAGTVTMFLLLQVTGAMRAAGNSFLPMLLMVGSNVLNIVLDVWFVFGGLGVAPMGVAGAAWATVLARGIFALVGVGALYRGFAGLVVRRLAWNGRMVWTILRIGTPSCAQWLVRMVFYLYLLRFLAEAAPLAGEGVIEAQAAFGVGLRLDTLALFSGIGWGAAAATFVGQNLGRGLPDRAVRASWIALGLNMAMMLLFAGAYVLFADKLLGAMGFDLGASTDVAAVMRMGRTYLYVTSAGYVFLAVGIVLSQALAGAGATKFPLLIEVAAYGAVGYPLTQWVARQADVYGLRALWAMAVALHLAVAIAYVLWFRFGGWVRKELR
jgi:MATE family, multidrug efflux pump